MESKPDEQMSPSQIGILQINNMSYKLAPDVAVVVQRNVQSSFFTSQSYDPGATMTCIVNSGSAFVNLKQSYLVLDVLNNSSGGAIENATSWFGSHGGSAANFINRIQIIAKNGVVLERIDNANALAAAKCCYMSQSWVQSVGSLAGIASSAAQLDWKSGSVANGAGGKTLRFIIPLYLFSTLCDSMDALCPSQLLSGSRFEIQLESATKAMISEEAGKTNSYAITACRIDFESYLLTDSVLRVINQTAASQGLEVVAATTQDTQSQRTSSQIVVDVARSCSRALNVLYKERAPLATVGYPATSLFDHMANAAITTNNIPSEWQCRAGQSYYPQSSLRNPGTTVGYLENELYCQTLRAFQKLAPVGEKVSARTSLFDFRGTTASGGSNACFALDLQRSAILTSGIPLSNSRQLSVFFQCTTSPPATFNVDVYLTYQILIRVFLSQCVLEV